MKRAAALLAALLPLAGAPAQDDVREAMRDVPLNSFRYAGNTLVCKQDTPAPNYLACLRIGDVRVGQSYRAFRERHPAAWKDVPLDNGVVASAHPAAGGKAYWVIGHRDDVIVSVQVTGSLGSPQLALATLQLGDSEEKALALLGPRAAIRAVPEIGGLLWDYAPFPVSVEFVGGRVYSMRVAAPDTQ